MTPTPGPYGGEGRAFFSQGVGGGSGPRAPADAEFLLAAENQYLPNGRVGTNSATAEWDFSIPGEARINVIGGGGGGGGSGDVVGPSSAVNNQFAAFDGTTGKLIKDSGVSAASFDAAGTGAAAAAAAVAAHEAASNPHPTYLTQAEADALYSVLGHTHVLANITDAGSLAALNSVGTSQIDNDAVSNTKLANVPTATFKGRTTFGTGDPEDLTVTQAKALLNLSGTNTGDQTITLTGDITGSGTGSFATTIANDAVTNAKLANVPTATFKGRTTAATGDPEDLTVAQAKALLDLSGTNTGDQTIALTGDVTGSGTGSFAATVANNSVSNAKLADMAAWTIKVRNAGTSGDPSDVASGDVTEEATPGSGDLLLGWDASGNLRTFDVGNLPTGGGGEANTASNTGVGGVGVFARKTGIDLEFKNLIAGSARLTVVDDTGDDEITLDVPADAFDSRYGLLSGTLAQFAATTSAQLRGVLSDETGTGAAVFADSPLFAGTPTFPNTGLHLLDTDATHDLILKPGSNLTADRTLTLTTGDADRTLTLSADATISGTNTGDQTITLTGDVTGSGTGSFATTIANDAVTYAKMQNVSATDKLLGRSSAGAGDVEEIACTAAGRALLDDADAAAQRTTLGAAATSSTLAQFAATTSAELAGVISDETGSGALVFASAPTIDAPIFTSSATFPSGGFQLLDSAEDHTLTIRCFENLTANRSLSIIVNDGNKTLTISGATTISGTNTGDQTITLTGDVTGTGTGSFAATIANDAVTMAKLANIASQTILGRGDAGSGDPSACTFETGIQITTGEVFKAAGRYLRRTIYTSGSGTHTPGTDCNLMKAYGFGAGGGGGGADQAGAGQMGTGAGGAAGAYGEKIAANSGTYSYSVGSLGAGGTAGDNDGSTGNDSTFSGTNFTLVFKGGPGGQGGASTAASNCNQGGTGGISTGCDINGSGQCGFPSGVILGSSGVGFSGQGGSTPWGRGGGGRVGHGVGSPGTGFGAGGGGAAAVTTSTPRAGGDGTGGIIVVEEMS